MDMRMSEQVLAPGVENAEDADFRAQVPGVRRDFQQGGGSSGEQEMVKDTGVVLRQEVEFVGNGEDHVKVRSGQQFLFPCGKPTLARLGLALGAVPIATRVVRDGLKSALGTGIEVTSERGGAAVQQGAEGFELLEIEARSIPVKETLALGAEDVGHLHGGPSHFLCFRRDR
jgi:hypothetical protein